MAKNVCIDVHPVIFETSSGQHIGRFETRHNGANYSAESVPALFAEIWETSGYSFGDSVCINVVEFRYAEKRRLNV